MFVSLIAPLLPIDPAATDVANLSQSPSLQHLFGTDEVGRDYFIRVIYGGRISLIVGLLAMVTAVTIGTIVGLIAGYVGGVVDTLLMRLVDVLSSIPWLVLVIVLSVFLKPGIGSIIIVIGCFSWMRLARLVRAETLSAKEYDIALEESAKFMKQFPDYIEMIVLHCVLSKYILPSDEATIIYQQSIEQIQIIAEKLTNLQQKYNALGNLLLLYCLFNDISNKQLCLSEISNLQISQEEKVIIEQISKSTESELFVMCNIY